MDVTDLENESDEMGEVSSKAMGNFQPRTECIVDAR